LFAIIGFYGRFSAIFIVAYISVLAAFCSINMAKSVISAARDIAEAKFYRGFVSKFNRFSFLSSFCSVQDASRAILVAR
jgi:hypothetical protein